MSDIEPTCCPVCDNAILAWEGAVVVVIRGCKCLVHEGCADELVGEDDDDDDQ